MAQDKIIVIMMEENNNIFFPGSDALVYLTKLMHKKYSTTFFGAIHLVRMYLRTIFQPSPPCKHLYAFRVTVTRQMHAYYVSEHRPIQTKNMQNMAHFI